MRSVCSWDLITLELEQQGDIFSDTDFLKAVLKRFSWVNQQDRLIDRWRGTTNDSDAPTSVI